MTEQYEKHALVSWKTGWDNKKGCPSEELRFQSYKDGIERESLNGELRLAISVPREISGYVEESKIEWAKLQLLIERQKYLIEGIKSSQEQLSKITNLIEEEWGRINKL